MSLARTDWGAGIDVPGAERDPFAGAGPVEQIGLPIDLSKEVPALHDRLLGLLDTEGALFERGVTCSLKEKSWATCSACPITHHADPKHRLSLLCRVGREQEQVQMEIAVADGACP